MKPCVIWELRKKCLEHTNRCITVMSRLFGFSYYTMCILCGLQTDSLAIHLIMYCRSNSSVRFQLWNCLHVCLGQNNYDLFINLTPKEQCIEMISALPSFCLSGAKRKECYTQVIILLHKLGGNLRVPYVRGSGIIW